MERQGNGGAREWSGKGMEWQGNGVAREWEWQGNGSGKGMEWQGNGSTVPNLFHCPYIPLPLIA